MTEKIEIAFFGKSQFRRGDTDPKPLPKIQWARLLTILVCAGGAEHGDVVRQRLGVNEGNTFSQAVSDANRNFAKALGATWRGQKYFWREYGEGYVHLDPNIGSDVGEFLKLLQWADEKGKEGDNGSRNIFLTKAISLYRHSAQAGPFLEHYEDRWGEWVKEVRKKLEEKCNAAEAKLGGEGQAGRQIEAPSSSRLDGLIRDYRDRLKGQVGTIRLSGKDEPRELEKVFVHLTITDYARPEREDLRGHFNQLLRNGQVTIFLDGLDEIGYGDELCLKIADFFKSAYHDNSLFISTRPYALKGEIEGLQEQMEIAPLNEQQIGEFINHYFGASQETQKFLARLLFTELREMAQVPLLLGFIIRLWRRGEMIPDNRLELYDRIVLELVSEYDAGKHLKKPGRDFSVHDPGHTIKRGFLKYLAFARLFDDGVQDNTEQLIFSRSQLVEEAQRYCQDKGKNCDPDHLADDATKTALLHEAKLDEWRFTYLTLQEYLAALALFEHPDCERIFCRACHNPKLAGLEVLPMTLGKVKKPDEFYRAIEQLPEFLSFTGLRLRVRGLVYRVNICQPLMEKLTTQMLEVGSQLSRRSKDVEPFFSKAILRSLSGIEGRNAIYLHQHISQLLQSEDRDCLVRAFAAEVLGQISGERAIEVLIATLNDQDSSVRTKAVKALGQIGGERAIEVLIAALNHQHFDVQGYASWVLSQIGDEQTVEAIIALFGHQHSNVRARAALTLDKMDRQTLLEGLVNALSHADSFVRREAAELVSFYSIGSYSVGRVEKELLRLAASDPDSEVREVAEESLAELRHFDKSLNGGTPD